MSSQKKAAEETNCLQVCVDFVSESVEVSVLAR